VICTAHQILGVRWSGRMRWALARSTHDRQWIRNHFWWENWRQKITRRTQTSGGISNAYETSRNEFIWLTTASSDGVGTFRRVYCCLYCNSCSTSHLAALIPVGERTTQRRHVQRVTKPSQLPFQMAALVLVRTHSKNKTGSVRGLFP